MVLGPGVFPRWLSLGDSSQEGPSVLSGRGDPSPQPRDLEPVGLASERAQLIDFGLSTEVVETIFHSRAPSTRKLYVFSDVLSLHIAGLWTVGPSYCPIGTVLELLLVFFSTGLSPSTLKVEVRHFLTSVAADQISRTESGVYIPTGLTGVAEHGIVDAAIDNFDQNEDTLDGKCTTHAMASVVFRRGQVSTADKYLARVPQRSLTTLNTFDMNVDKLYRYIKSTKRPEPHELAQPELLHTNTTISKAAEDRDLVWKLSRNVIENQQHVPAWSAFNDFTSDTACSVASVLYLPFIIESPSELSTIYTSMIRLVQLAAELGQHHILVTADLTIYSKAQQILWSKPSPLQRKITMRLGVMHITMAYLASIGKLYGDGGLFDILSQMCMQREQLDSCFKGNSWQEE
ncbi:hypothetical protein PO909_020699 [Leuciscus waleckii]